MLHVYVKGYIIQIIIFFYSLVYIYINYIKLVNCINK